MDNVFPKRKWMRLRNYDYASQKVYFITLCTQNRERILSEIVGRGLDPSVRAEVTLMPYGSIAEYDLMEIPNHFPNVEILNPALRPSPLPSVGARGRGAVVAARTPPLPTVSTIIGQYKAGVSRKCKRAIWQKYYHDHIIRNQLDFEETWKYIDNNPLQWVLDGKA